MVPLTLITPDLNPEQSRLWAQWSGLSLDPGLSSDPWPVGSSLLVTAQSDIFEDVKVLQDTVRYIILLEDADEKPPLTDFASFFTPNLFPLQSFSGNKWLQLSVPSALAYHERIVMGFCDCYLRRHPLEERDEFAFRTAIQEAAANGLLHGNLELKAHYKNELESFDEFIMALEEALKDPPKKQRRLEIAAGLEDGCVKAVISDEGRGYNVDRTEASSQDASYGRGLSLIANLSKSFHISDSGRRVDLYFSFPFQPSPFSSAPSEPPTQALETQEADIKDQSDITDQEPARAFMEQYDPSEGQDEETLESGWLRQCRVLIVDDAELSRETIAAIVEAAGFEILAFACDGEEALQKVSFFQPDIIILDLVMPKVSGIEVCQTLRAHEKHRRLPILVLTGLEDTQSRIDVFRAGATDLVIKPVNAEELIARMRVHLENRFLIGRLQEYRDRMEADLVLAHAMQHELLPKTDIIEKVKRDFNLDIESLFMPSSALGGDCWGILDIPQQEGKDKKVALYLVDFSGHGVAPAVNTFRLHTLFSDIQDDFLESPEAVLGHLNSRLKQLLPRGQFAAMIYVVFEPEQDRIRYAASAFPSPILCHNKDQGKNGCEIRTVDASGVPLGLIDGAQYPEKEIHFPAGSGLMLFSDGLCDLHIDSQNRLEEEGVRDFVLASVPLKPPFLKTKLGSYLDSLTERPEDDMTVLFLHRPRETSFC